MRSEKPVARSTEELVSMLHELARRDLFFMDGDVCVYACAVVLVCVCEWCGCVCVCVCVARAHTVHCGVTSTQVQTPYLAYAYTFAHARMHVSRVHAWT